MRCGNCKRDHDTVADVKACYAESGRIKAPAASAVHKADGPQWPPSDKQVSYLLGLQEERLLPEAYNVLNEKQVRSLEKDEVSATIGLLTTYPRKPGATTGGGQTKYTMPEGRYALLVDTTVDPEWRFYEVSKPTKGRWAGYTFINRLIGAPGDYQKIKVAADDRARLLGRIERDPKKAMMDYGQQSGVCGRCSSPLSDPTSLALGIGPVCRQKDGWF